MLIYLKTGLFKKSNYEMHKQYATVIHIFQQKLTLSIITCLQHRQDNNTSTSQISQEHPIHPLLSLPPLKDASNNTHTKNITHTQTHHHTKYILEHQENKAT